MPDIKVSQIRGNEVSVDGRFARVACSNDAGEKFNMVEFDQQNTFTLLKVNGE